MSWKKGIPNKFSKFTGKHGCRGLFLNKVIGQEKRLQHICFLVNFSKFCRKPFFIEHLQWLVLSVKWRLLFNISQSFFILLHDFTQSLSTQWTITTTFFPSMLLHHLLCFPILDVGNFVFDSNILFDYAKICHLVFVFLTSLNFQKQSSGSVL